MGRKEGEKKKKKDQSSSKQFFFFFTHIAGLGARGVLQMRAGDVRAKVNVRGKRDELGGEAVGLQAREVVVGKVLQRERERER